MSECNACTFEDVIMQMIAPYFIIGLKFPEAYQSFMQNFGENGFTRAQPPNLEAAPLSHLWNFPEGGQA
jgi:hypothetical protein